MFKIILFIHIILSCLLILFILINKSKGSEIGATFNSVNTDLLNIKESNSILKKIIIFLALILLISTLSINSIKKYTQNNQDKPIVQILKK